MSIFLFGLALGLAILDWLAVARDWRKLEHFAKPGVMIVLLAWVGYHGGFSGGMLWFALGLLFSLGGDVFLMLPPRFFILGLVSFLIGHIGYIIGFNLAPPVLNLPSLILAVFVILAGSQIYLRIAAGLKARSLHRLKLPVLLYSIVISLMLLSALCTLLRLDWSLSAAAFASAGALLFFISDTLLAWNRFVTPLTQGRLISIIPYHLGQFCIALGAALHFLNL